jgi:class 3 adenylate cyclase/tetratricopeptide (TPR) repeat protein
MDCHECGFELAEGMNFCGQCGAKLASDSVESPSLSRSSSKEQSLLSKYLPSGLSDKILSSARKIEGERRQVTALFADVMGYTSMSETIGEEAVYKLMDRIYECMITPVYNEEGSVQKLTGDGMFAIFGAPVALEDAPYRACRAAWRVQENMKILGSELQTSHGVNPRLRIGIHTGPVVLGSVGTDHRMEFTALGDTVNLASRLESLAEPGGILMSKATCKLVETFVSCTYAGEREVKGKTEPQKVYVLDGLKEKATRFDTAIQHGLSPFVGRDREIEELRSFCESACGGQTLLVQVEGEAGIGKSRLVYEFQRWLEEKQVPFLKTHCTSFGMATSYLPFVEVVRGIFAIEDRDGREAVEQKLLRGITSLGVVSAKAVPLLMAFMGFDVDKDAFRGMDEVLVGERTRQTLLEIIHKQCAKSAMVLVIEDLHWMDKASEDLIGRILDARGAAPLLLLCSYRPEEYRSPWTGHDAARSLQVEPLSRESTVLMMQGLLGIDEVSDDIAETVIGKSECNPLFTEEVTRYLLESGNLKRIEKDVSYHLSSASVEIPTSIVDLLQSRVDTLAEGPKEILQVASVIGRRFSHELVRQITGGNGSFTADLGELEVQDLVKREEVEGRVEYKFKHALIQDAIYSNLLKDRKESLHESVGRTIEALYPERIGEWVETLSYHWGNTSNVEKAVKYTIAAGEKSLKVYALEEADQRFRLAVELLDIEGVKDDSLLTDVLLSWVRVFFYRQKFKGLIVMVEKYLDRVEALGDKRRLSMLLFWLGHACNAGGHGRKAKDILEKAKALGEEIGDSMCIRRACAALLWSYTYWTPDLKEAEKMVDLNYRRSMELSDEVEDSFSIYHCYLARGAHELTRGRYGKVVQYANNLEMLGERTGDRRFTATGMWLKGYTYVYEERFDEALEAAEKTWQTSTDPLDRISSRIIKGAVFTLTGKVREGYGFLNDARSEMLESGFIFPMNAVGSLYGVSLVMSGRMTEGVRSIESFMEWFTSLGNYQSQVNCHSTLAEIYTKMATSKVKPPLKVLLKNIGFVLTKARLAEKHALHHATTAVKLAEEYDFPGHRAKGLRILARLSMARGDRSEARLHLEEAVKAAELAESEALAASMRSMLDSIAPEKAGK